MRGLLRLWCTQIAEREAVRANRKDLTSMRFALYSTGRRRTRCAVRRQQAVGVEQAGGVQDQFEWHTRALGDVEQRVAAIGKVQHPQDREAESVGLTVAFYAWIETPSAELRLALRVVIHV